MELPDRPNPMQLRAFFGARSLPPGPLYISEYEVLTDPARFVESHLSLLEANPPAVGPRPFTKEQIQRYKAPYYFRLLRFVTFLQMRKIEFIVLHTTASPQTATVASIRAGWRARGWGETPGYHILITPDGIAHRLAPDASVTNGVAGYNAKCLHVCYVGGVMGKKLTPTDNRTDAQRKTMAEVVAAWVRIHPGAKVVGHRDFSPDLDGDGQIEPFEYIKACPCFDGAAWWNNVKKSFPDLAHTPDVPEPEAPKKKKAPAPKSPPAS